MRTQKKINFALLLISIFAFSLLFLTLYLDNQKDERHNNRIEPKEIYEMPLEDIENYLETRQENEPLSFIYLIPLIGLFGLIIGIIIYMLMQEKVTIIKKEAKFNTKILLQLVSKEEKTAITYLIDKGGLVPQYELTHLPSMNKVKTHRVLERLEKKEIITKEKIGKVNNIKLKSEFLEIFK